MQSSREWIIVNSCRSESAMRFQAPGSAEGWQEACTPAVHARKRTNGSSKNCIGWPATRVFALRPGWTTRQPRPLLAQLPYCNETSAWTKVMTARRNPKRFPGAAAAMANSLVNRLDVGCPRGLQTLRSPQWTRTNSFLAFQSSRRHLFLICSADLQANPALAEELLFPRQRRVARRP